MSGYQDYLEAGFTVIGMHPITHDMKCSCRRKDCKAAGKHPINNNWQKAKVTSAGSAAKMDALGHLKSFGVLVDGYLVIDVDPRNGGEAGYEALCAALDMNLDDESGLVVKTGGGGKHLYFRLEDGIKLRSHDKRFRGIDFKVSGFVIGAGSFHKSGEFYTVEKGNPHDIATIPPELAILLKVDESSNFQYGGDEFTDTELSEMVSFISGGDEYEQWIRVGMAIHEATEGNGIELWDKWSKGFDGYEAGAIQYKWASFGRYGGERVGSATLSMLATENGWRQSINFEPTQEEIASLERVEKEFMSKAGRIPIDYKGVDISNPPGIVGKMASWINQNCPKERKRLSAMAAIYAASIMTGHRFDIYLTPRKANANLFCVGLAGSGSGKGDVLSALNKMIDFMGLSRTVAGKIRSERAVYDGLVSNQMFNLVMDEIGIKLNSVIGPRVSEYNNGTGGALLECFSANGIMNVDQRICDEYIEKLQKRMSLYMGLLAENELEGFTEQEIKDQFSPVITRIDGKIIDPFLSIFGLSADETFRKLISEDNIRSGLIGRAFIIQELQQIPKRNPDYRNDDMSINLKMRIASIIGNNTDEKKNLTGTIIGPKNRRVIKSRPDVEAKAEEIFDWIDRVANMHVEAGTGFEPIINRCSEKIAKISGILACESGIIEMEHLQYAVMLTMLSVSDLMMRANSLSAQTAKSNEEKIFALRSLICEYAKRGMARKATIRGVAKDGKFKRDDVETMISQLLDENVIAINADAPRANNRSIIYCLVDEESDIDKQVH